MIQSIDHSLSDVLSRLGTPRLLVVGDLILDRYTWGDVERVSPEAPVLVLRADEEEVRPGGAASVAALLRGLDAEVVLAGVVGDDANGRLLRRLLSDAGIDQEMVVTDPGRPTTSKERLLGRTGGRQPHQMLRIDRESRRPLSDELERQLSAAISGRIEEFDAVLISDYAKGVCITPLVQAVIAGCRERNKPVLVDPARRPDYRLYAGATLVKPNRTELQLATGWSAATLDEAAVAGRKLCRDLDLAAVVATLDRDGMLLIPDEGDPLPVPTTPQEVCDVTGAGDMSLATLGLCLAGGAALAVAVRLANVAAGLEVQRLGIATVTRTEVAEALAEPQATQDKRISRETAGRLADEYRRRGRRIVFTNGCFDLLHVGHLACLREAKALGDVLFVAINSDASVRRLKGATRPVINEEHRAELLAALECVDHVIVFDEDTPHALLRDLRPDFLVKGGTTATVIGHEVVESAGGRIHRTTAVPGKATSRIIESIREAVPPPEARVLSGLSGSAR